MGTAEGNARVVKKEREKERRKKRRVGFSFPSHLTL